MEYRALVVVGDNDDDDGDGDDDHDIDVWLLRFPTVLGEEVSFLKFGR